MAVFSADVLKAHGFRRDLRTRFRGVFQSAAQQEGNPPLSVARFFLLLSFVFACVAAMPQAAHGSVGVWLQSPKPGTNPNTFKVYATGSSSSAITGWAIYVDDAVAYRTSYSSDTLSHTLTVANGRHLLYVRAWNTKGYGTSAVLMIQVGPPPSSSTTLPTPPSSAKVLTEIQNTSSGWKMCSICAEGTNDTANYWMAPYQHTPSVSGSSRELYADGGPWTNVLFIKTMPETSSATHFLWDFWVYHNSTSAANIWSSEFDLWQTLGGKEFMMGSQCAFGNGVWDTWDSANNRWIENGVPCPRWAPNTWHHIQWYIERINSTQYRYDTLVVDGHGYGFNQVWTVNPINWPNAIGVQWQIDQSSNGDPIHQWIDKVKLTTW